MANGEWQMADGKVQVASNKPQLADAKKRKRDGHQPPSYSHKQFPGVEVDLAHRAAWLPASSRRSRRRAAGTRSGVLTSAKCTSEENYLVNKLTRQVIGTNNIDHCARL